MTHQPSGPRGPQHTRRRTRYGDAVACWALDGDTDDPSSNRAPGPDCRRPARARSRTGARRAVDGSPMAHGRDVRQLDGRRVGSRQRRYAEAHRARRAGVQRLQGLRIRRQVVGDHRAQQGQPQRRDGGPRGQGSRRLQQGPGRRLRPHPEGPELDERRRLEDRDRQRERQGHRPLLSQGLAAATGRRRPDRTWPTASGTRSPARSMRPRSCCRSTERSGSRRSRSAR